MKISYDHNKKGVAVDPNPVLLTVSNPTIACTDVEVTIQEPVTDIVESGVIGYRTIVSNPDALSADDKVLIDTPVQGANTISGADLSLLSYDSITDTSTKNFYTYGYVKYSDGSYKYSDMQTNTFTPNTLSNDLEAYYSFDGNANDLTGNGHDGTLRYSPTQTGGVINSAYEFNGSNDYIELDNLGLDGGDYSMTAFVWIDSYSTNEQHQILCLSPDDTIPIDRSVYFRVDDLGRVQVIRFTGNSNNSIVANHYSNSTLSTGSWYHAVVSFSTTDGSYIYVNGSVDGYDSNTTPFVIVGNDKYTIGARNEPRGGDNESLDGKLDEIGAYKKALNNCEVKLLYRKGQGLPYA